ncbi:hypothetical protein [Streptomyces sp. NBRC 110035]|nr:hypothetical protein [Streptomyces sp. NBRC 110035]
MNTNLPGTALRITPPRHLFTSLLGTTRRTPRVHPASTPRPFG